MYIMKDKGSHEQWRILARSKPGTIFEFIGAYLL